MVGGAVAHPAATPPAAGRETHWCQPTPAPPGMNGVLTGVGKVEAALVKRVAALPIGTSILCIAER